MTTVENTHNIDIPALNTFLMARDMRISNGYGDLKGKTFRIAHMGEVQMADIEILLDAIDEFLKVSGV